MGGSLTNVVSRIMWKEMHSHGKRSVKKSVINALKKRKKVYCEASVGKTGASIEKLKNSNCIEKCEFSIEQSLNKKCLTSLLQIYNHHTTLHLQTVS